ncbi:MAG: hypothetical protein PVH42_16740, partial [Desulfobacterales bacterium]
MFIRRLRPKIAVNIAVLLLVAMILIDLVSVVTVRRELIRSEVSKASLILSFIEDQLQRASAGIAATVDSESDSLLRKLIADSRIANALLLKADGETLYFGEPSEIPRQELVSHTQRAISAGKEANHFFGTTWGIFWKQKAKLIASTPLKNNNSNPLGLSIVLPLENVYNVLRHSQQIIFIYIAINLFILTYIGIHRISKLYLLPLGRLAKRAEDY